MKNHKPSKAAAVIRIVLLVLLGLVLMFVLEFGKHTIWGWGLCIAVFAGYIILRCTILRHRRGILRFGSVLPFLILLTGILFLSQPPYRKIPAADYPNPQITDVVQIPQGELTGVVTQDGDVEIYAGIPFAKPPIGDLRFREPQNPEPWEGILACDTFAPKAMQAEGNVLFDSLVDLTFYHYFQINLHDNYREPMSEDCLYLNVWKPAGDISGLPVLVYIHGGSLVSGSSSYMEYRGQSLAQQGIVVVTVAYRLNIFGYLASEDLAAESPNGTTGNYGLLDQVKALQWVHDNIAAFGGDPDKVTIAGESAGASSVNALCVSPLTEGLFRYAIAESSGITAKVPYHTFRSFEEATEMGESIKEEFGVSDTADLRAVPAEKLLHTRYSNDSMTVDGYAIAEQPFLTYERGANHEQALLSGFNSHEADVFLLGRKVDADNYIPVLSEVFGDYASEVAQQVPPRAQDPDYKIFVDAGGNAKGALNEAVSAAWFTYSHYNWSRLLAAQNKPVWEYTFTKWNPSLSSYHAGELPYVYGNLYRHDWAYTKEDEELSALMQKYWVNFVKTGDPNAAELPEWKPFAEDPEQVMELGTHVGMIRDPHMALYEIIDRQQDALWR